MSVVSLDRMTNSRFATREPDPLSGMRWTACGWCGGQRVYAEPMWTPEGSVYALVVCPRCCGIGEVLG